LSEEKKSNPSESAYLLESPYVYVTGDGDVILKETSFSDERKITSVDPESAESQVKALENAFDNLKAKTDNFFNEISDAADLNEEDVRNSFEELKKEILASDTVGDFESLIKESQERLEKIFEESVDDSEPEEEPEAEAAAEPESSADEGEAEITPEAEVTAEEDAGEKEKEKEEEAEAAETETGEVSETEAYYKELAEKAEQLIDVSDWAYVSMEFDNIDTKWEEGPDPEEVDITGYRETIDR